ALGFALEELGRIFLSRTTAFTDHDARLGFAVGQEHFQHVNEVGALDRIAADTDTSGAAAAFVRGLEHCFIGKRAGTGNNTHRTLLEDIARHDADLAFFRGQDAWAVWSEQARLRAFQTLLDANHVHDRNTFGDADDERDFGFD